MAFFVPVLHNHHVFEWGLTVNQNQKKDYIRKQLWKDTSSIYEKAHPFYNLPRNFSTGLLTRGCTYKKNCVYQALSLSLSLSLSLLHWKREQEERSGGVGPWLGPTTWLPFSANMFRTQLAYRSLLLVRWQYRSKSPYQVVDLVEPPPLLRLVRYLLPDPGGLHQFAQLVCTYYADWWNWWPVPLTGPTIHRGCALAERGRCMIHHGTFTLLSVVLYVIDLFMIIKYEVHWSNSVRALNRTTPASSKHDLKNFRNNFF